MAHKIGENDTVYEPDIGGAVDFSFFRDDSVVDRTKGCGTGMVSGPTVSCVVGSSSSQAPSCLEDSRYRCVEVTSSSSEARASRRRQGEGHKGGEEVWRRDSGSEGISLSPNTAGMVGGSASSFEAQQLEQQPGQACAVMEHVDHHNPYSSDDWEESDLSDTDGDHSDSSDDDDPKSQVDRLIDQVTLTVYLDGENSNLSSESESSDESEYDDSDSESDITDVSPLISATASPLGLSPVLPRRTLGTSPLALHDNRDLGLDYQSEEDHGYPSALPGPSPPHYNGMGHSDDSTDMSKLLKAVVELEKKKRRKQAGHRSRSDTPHHHSHQNGHDNHYNHHHHNGHITHTTPSSTDNHLNDDSGQEHQSNPMTIHPIDASPHHRHLRRHTSHHQQHRRKNMSFTNEEVRRIDRENHLLLQKIVSAHNRSNNRQQGSSNRSVHRPANATVSRRREEERIRRENMILLRKIQEAKPSREVASFRSPRHRASPGLRPPSSLPPPTPGSCGATARSGHAATPTPRKETAL